MHHTSLLWDWTPDNMDCLTLPPSMPTYRAARAHGDFLTALAPHGDSPAALFAALEAALGAHFTLQGATVEQAVEAAAAPTRDTRVGTQWVDLRGWSQAGPPPGVPVR